MHFSWANCFYLFKKAPGQQIVPLLNVFDFLNHQVFRKIDKNCMKFSKIWIFEYFCHFRSKFDAFFLAEIAIISSNKPLGEQMFSFLNVFDIVSTKLFEK